MLEFCNNFSQSGYHFFLIFNGLTTVEYIKKQTAQKVLKENEKLVNTVQVETSQIKSKHKPKDAILRLCAPNTGPYIDWNDWVDDNKSLRV